MQLNNSEIRLSVALVTRNRPDSLNRCLESLRSQNVQPYEVVISDDSNPELASATKEIANRWDCQYITGPRRGLYANRNYVALACKGTHIRTMDDDHELPQGHLKQCLEAVTSDPKSIWTTGEIGFINDKYWGTSQTATQLYPYGAAGPVTDINNNWAIADGSTIYPREVFEQGHRMVEYFGFGSIYLEFGAYLYRHGFRSRSIPDALVKHYATENTILMINDVKVLESQLYASLCYNLYFQPNYILAAKYTFGFIKRSRFDQNLISSLPELFHKAKTRWTL